MEPVQRSGQVIRGNAQNLTGFGIYGLIAGLVKIDFFFQERHLLSSSTAYTKYERFA